MRSFWSKKNLASFLLLLFLISSLPFLLKLVQKVQKFLTTAVSQPANIVVDTQNFQGILYYPWQALAQGGEETDPQNLQPVLSEIKMLTPQYLRLDHIYDFYQVVTKDSHSNLIFNWLELDQIVDTIIQAGATPFLSLSYLPPAITTDGSPLGLPQDWLEWQEVVQKTIEHYSGQDEKNLTNVYYEVFNEPDLFGHWQIGGQKDYRLLYFYASQAADQAQNTHPFKIGGPALTHYQPKWFSQFLNYVEEQNLRLDFISWHTYSPQVSRFVDDFSSFHRLVSQRSKFAFKEIILSEWGSDSENSPWHDNQVDAAHTIAVSQHFPGNVNWAFSFEIKDGPSPENKKFWGRWGLLTHQDFGVEKKPRFWALYLLNQLGNQRLEVEGEGTWVTGLAAQKENTIQLLLANYDPQEKHQETVPVQFAHLPSGKYQLRKTFLNQEPEMSERMAVDGAIEDLIFMPENSVVLLELTPLF